MFGDEISYREVRLRRRKWFPFQPRKVTMAPIGHIHFHPESETYCDDFSLQPLSRQGFFIHEMTHVWQTQAHGKFYLLFKRMPWARYSYSLKPGWPLARYGVEQQAEIIRHAFLLRNGAKIPGVTGPDAYEALVDFQSTS
jgi:hypothetical protein